MELWVPKSGTGGPQVQVDAGGILGSIPGARPDLRCYVDEQDSVDDEIDEEEGGVMNGAWDECDVHNNSRLNTHQFRI